MNEVAPTTEVVTMGSVRPDDNKRGVPLDRATFRAHADILGSQSVREIHGLPKRVHLIGDATLLAVKVAQEHEGDFGAAVDHLRKILVTGEHHDFEDVLDPFTQEKFRVEAGITRVLGQSGIEIASSIAYLRDYRRYAEFAMDILGALFSKIRHGSESGVGEVSAVDITKLNSSANGIGFVKEGQRVIPKPCDPHILDSNNNGGEDAGALASAPLGLFLKGEYASTIPDIARDHSMSTGPIIDWVRQILKRLERLETGGNPKNISPLIPGRDVDVWGSIVEAMGKEILAP